MTLIRGLMVAATWSRLLWNLRLCQCLSGLLSISNGGTRYSPIPLLLDWKHQKSRWQTGLAKHCILEWLPCPLLDLMDCGSCEQLYRLVHRAFLSFLQFSQAHLFWELGQGNVTSFDDRVSPQCGTIVGKLLHGLSLSAAKRQFTLTRSFGWLELATDDDHLSFQAGHFDERFRGSLYLNHLIWSKFNASPSQGEWMNEWKKIEKESGYAVYALPPKKDERYRRRGIKVEPKWLGMGEYVIFRTLELKLLGRSHYKSCYPSTILPVGGGS